MTRTRTRAVGLLAALLAAGLLAVLCAMPAQAAGYRYWSFWDRGDDGAWAYASQGPSVAQPDDGAVQGFRFSVSEDSADAAKPRGTAGFGTICDGTPAQDGRKRIALVIDFGTAKDAPGGAKPPGRRTACARIAEDGTSADALAAVAKPLRYDNNALLCAIAGYPRTGCGEQVAGEGEATGSPDASASASGTEAEDDGGGGGPAVGIVVGVGAVLVLGAGAVWQARRRRG
ncbi:hypothetical protein DSC45_14575 [Streptomyces sp. YIM 130001]|uniref:SCO2322 family protein n=1 Tax=Streptomyces sp. YIM 130001 TaxID=2259644 RepID=UPI000E652332|nr:SCO2322 family protein [Streptomyces sp. YIM 130001]RII16985.1 hypothetical protein DSC45_14575 [Streptomyces sp. YIM 130001]